MLICLLRLDFKSGSLDTLKGKVEFLEIRSLLSTKETVFISSNNKIYHFIENWKLYPDHGVLRDQKLYTFDSNLIVEEIIMESILDTVILVTMKFYKQNDL